MFNGCVASAKNCVSSVWDPVCRAASYADEKGSLSQRVDNLYNIAESMYGIPLLATGVLAGIVTCLSAGFRKKIGDASQKVLDTHGTLLLPDIYKSFLGVLYPNMPQEINAKIESQDEKKELRSYANEKIQNLLKKGDAYSDSQNVVVRHVVSRATYVVTAAVSVISRLALGVLGAGAALLSFIPYVHKKSQFMHFAYQELQVLGAVQDVFYCAVKFLNPWTEVVHGG